MLIAGTAASPQLAGAQYCGPAPGVLSAQQRKDDEKQRRLYRVGLSYRCGRCGKPKKGHVCDQPDEGAAELAERAAEQAAGPAILATTVRKGTPPTLLGSPLAGGAQASPLPVATASPRNSNAKTAAVSPMNDVKIAGEATSIFKDMVAALGEGVISPGGASLSSPPLSAGGSQGISPLAASAIASGHVSAASAAAPAIASIGGAEPQLSDMDLMLADLAFAARPPPVMTPEEGGHEGHANDGLGTDGPVGNGLGSLSPSNFSPGTMIQQLITTPGGTNGWSPSQIAEMTMAGHLSASRSVAQPSA